MNKTKALSSGQLRNLDRRATERFGIPSLLLMENAASACVEESFRRYPKARRFAIVCGPGNNGGDGFAIARKLHLAGKNVKVFHCGRPVSADAGLNFLIVQKLSIPCADLRKSSARRAFIKTLANIDVIVDALFGI